MPPVGSTWPAMVVPLFQSSLPVLPSSAYKTAGLAAEPPERAKTRPFTTMGGSGAVRSRDAQPGWSDSLPPWSTTLNATTAPLLTLPLAAGKPADELSAPVELARIQRSPSTSQLARAPATEEAKTLERASGVL